MNLVLVLAFLVNGLLQHVNAAGCGSRCDVRRGLGSLGSDVHRGLSHVNRCLFADAKMRALRDNWPLWLGWQVLLVLLSIRMARTLGLLA